MPGLHAAVTHLSQYFAGLIVFTRHDQPYELLTLVPPLGTLDALDALDAHILSLNISTICLAQQ